MTKVTPFGSYAKIYTDAGFTVRPTNGKRPFLKDWEKPNAFFPDGTMDEWIEKYADCNIGTVSGSLFPDGTRLGFFDIDSDAYVRLGKVLFGNPECVRIGSKGIVIPVRYTDGLTVSKKISVKGEKNGDVAEFLFGGAICIIPPSMHPDTGRPYRWEGPSLLEIDYKKLPLIGE